MKTKIKYCLIAPLLFFSAPVVGQSLFYADDKERFLKELEAKSIPGIRQELADASLEMKDLAEQFKRLENLFNITDDKSYTEASAVVTPAYRLPDEKLVTEQFYATVAASEFEQYYRLPDASFMIRPPEKKGASSFLDVDYRIKELYRDGKAYDETQVGLMQIDSLKATAVYSVPTKMATVKINAGQKEIVYRNAKIFLDAIHKNQVRFRVDTAINDDLLEVFALTRGGKLVDHSGYRNSSNKDNKELSRFMGQVVTFLDASVKDIDTHPKDAKEMLTARIAERLTALKLPEKSGVNYKEYDFKGNVQTLVLYFREDKRVFRQDITAYNKDKSGKRYNLFSDIEGKFGIADAAGSIIVDAQYESLSRVNDNYYYALREDRERSYFYFDRQAKKMIALKGIDYMDDAGAGWAVSRRLIKEDTVDYDDEYKAALYNANGKQVIPEQYASLELMGNVVFYQAVHNGKYGMMTPEGKKITEGVYDRVRAVVDGQTEEQLPLMLIEQDKHYSLVNREGKLLAPLQYDDPIVFNGGRAILVRKQGDKEVFGVMDQEGKELLPLQYDYISDYKEGMAIFEKEEKYGLLDRDGKIIIPARYVYMGDINDGMIIVRDSKGKYGALNSKGELTVPFQFSEIKAFQAGYAFVFTEDFYGVIDKTGKFTMKAPRPSSYGMSTNWEGKERTYQINDKEYNYKGDQIPRKK